MAQKTIDLIINLQAKNKDKVTKDISALEREAERLNKALSEATDPKEAARLNKELDKMNDELLKAVRVADKLEKELPKSFENAQKEAKAFAQRLEEIGGKYKQIGGLATTTGALITGPLVLLAKKYVDAYGDQEDTSKRLVALGEKFENVQIRIGRIAAEQLLPTLEKAVDLADKVATFVEANPEIVNAALGIGGTLVAAGAILNTVGTVAQTLGALKSIGLAGNLFAGGAGTAAAAGAGGAGLAASLTSAITAAAPIIVPLFAVAIGAQIGKSLGEAITGREASWSEIGETAKQLVIISAEGWDVLFNWLGINTNISAVMAEALNTSDLYLVERLDQQSKENANTVSSSVANTAQSIGNALSNGLGQLASSLSSFGANIRSGLSGMLSGLPGFAEGGEIGGPGLFMGGERGREFVLNNKTTKAAESLLGGRLSQERILQAMGGRKVSYYDARKFDASVSLNDRRAIRDLTLSAINEALG